MKAYTDFRANPSPANAVALAKAEFFAAHGMADSEYSEALALAESLLRAREAGSSHDD